MISSISGEIISISADSVTIEVHGMGFDVFVPRALLSEFHAGQRVSLFTHLVVREDLLALYGFNSIEEREFFLLMMSVEGIGPKTALATLSTLSTDAIRRAVLSEQPEIFNRVPGIGKKTAQKVIISLQGKVKGSKEEIPVSPMDEINAQVFDALVELGYSVVEAQTAIQSIPGDVPGNVEDRLRSALQYFG